MFYSELNKHVKNWHYYLTLRNRNENVKARQLERQSIRRNIKDIRLALEHNGSLELCNAMWSLNIPKHNDSGLTVSNHITGYYEKNKYCYLENICKSLGLLIIDSRGVDPYECIKLYPDMPDYKLRAKALGIKFINERDNL